MAKHHKLELTETEIQALVELRDKGEPAYLRERATVLLKIHQGSSPHEVACKGLLKARDPDTVYAWLRRYREHGLLGLSNKPGRGRKPAFSPKWTGKLSKKIGTLAKLPIEIVQLPTYASWTNPAVGTSVGHTSASSQQ